MTDYTDEQIYAAADIATSKTSPAYKNVGNHFLRAFLEALSDQQENWQECTFEEICTGDQVKTRRRGVTSVYEHPVVSTYRSGPLGRYVDLEKGSFHPDSDTTFYRIPAPVVHPHPEEHPIILVHAFDGDQMPEGTYASITQNQAHDYVYELVPGDGTHPVRTRPDAIDEWEPAKVVPSNYVGDYPTRKVEYKGFPND